MNQKDRKDAYEVLRNIIYFKKHPELLIRFYSASMLQELKTVNDFDEFDYRKLPVNILRAFAKYLEKNPKTD